MSFSNTVKEEISKLNIQSKIEGLLELSSLLKTNASISLRNAFIIIVFSTENKNVSKRIYKLIDYIYDYEPSLGFVKNNHLQKEGMYTLLIEDEKIVDRILQDSGIDYYGSYLVPERVILSRILNNQDHDKARAFLRGAFLGAGSIVDPKKSYHLEMVFNKEEDALITKKVMDRLGVNPLTGERKDKFILYIKDSELLADFLHIIGADSAMLELENVKAMKDLRNNINRQVNCDTANINKTISASARQIKQIMYIEENLGLDKLEPQIRELALIRKDYPELSLKQLGRKFNPPLSKSGVNNRFKKLEEVYERLLEK